MLKLRNVALGDAAPWIEVGPGAVAGGMCEDTDYVIAPVAQTGARLYVDDVELHPSPAGVYCWRPSFYAGRVAVEVVETGGTKHRYWLDISPSPAKSGEARFAEMVAEIRAFDQTLLGGTSAATMAFGREGRQGLYDDDILLLRLRKYGDPFLDVVEAIARSPHRSLSAESQVQPLSRIRKLHPAALRDRRVAALVGGSAEHAEAIETIQLRSITSSPTCDTPANQTLLALLMRFRAAAILLREKVTTHALSSPKEEQALRREHRLRELDKLESRVRRLVLGLPFVETSRTGTTSSGLTQIAAQPAYSRAYRLGCSALATGVDGDDAADMLHVNYSWGIYETWCFLEVVRCVQDIVGAPPRQTKPSAVSADMTFMVKMPDGGSLEVLFQANFPSLSEAPSGGRRGWSISRMRIPDIVLVAKSSKGFRTLILDAKWRSGRENVLDAMQSAHVYHDSLRLAGAAPTPCLLLLPGIAVVPHLEQPDFIAEHGVGAISAFCIGEPGIDRLRDMLKTWLEA